MGRVAMTVDDMAAEVADAFVDLVSEVSEAIEAPSDFDTLEAWWWDDRLGDEDANRGDHDAWWMLAREALSDEEIDQIAIIPF